MLFGFLVLLFIFCGVCFFVASVDKAEATNPKKIAKKETEYFLNSLYAQGIITQQDKFRLGRCSKMELIQYFHSTGRINLIPIAWADDVNKYFAYIDRINMETKQNETKDSSSQ